MTKKGKLKTYEEITRAVWGQEFDSSYHGHKIQTLIFDFKQKISQHGVSADFISNVYGQGYLLQFELGQKTTKRKDAKSRSETILTLARELNGITSRDLVAEFSYGDRQAQRDLAALVATGLLEASGGKKNRIYFIKKRAA